MSGPALTALVFGIQTIVTFGSNAGMLGGLTNPQVSVKYTSLVTPAGFAFAIWGIIFTSEAVMVSLPFLLDLAPATRSALASSTAAFVAANIFQTAWSWAFAYERLWIAACLLTSIAVSLFLAVTAFVATSSSSSLSWQALVVCGGPMALHGGWTAAAALVNWNLACVGASYSMPRQFTLAFSTIAASLLVAISAALTCGPLVLPFGGAIAWALFAIGKELKNPKGPLEIPPKFNNERLNLIFCAEKAAVGLSLALVVGGASIALEAL